MCLNPKTIYKKGYYISVGCGKCFECLQQRATEWAYRICLESSLYEHNCMVTLTYNEDNCPKDSHLSKRDLQLFMKRLRKHYNNVKVKFFACGEYGDKKGRPHYHIILFNMYFEDMFWFCKDKKGTDLYRSPVLERLWNKGFSSICEIEFNVAKYCAIYMQKPPKDGRPKPFLLMSRRPGIGFGAIREEWLASDKIYYNGRYIKIPRYFLDVLSRSFPNLVETLKNNRMDKILKFNDSVLAEIEYNDRLKRIKRLQKIFGSDMKEYFELFIDFGEMVEIQEENHKIIEEMKKPYKIFDKTLDFSKLPSIMDSEVCVKAIDFCE